MPDSTDSPKRRKSAALPILLLIGIITVVVMLCLDLSTIAQVGQHRITNEEASLALRESLWKQQLSWHELTPEQQQTQRELALQNLMDAHLLHQLSLTANLDEQAIQQEAERRLQQNIKQFENSSAWQQRISAQNLSEIQLREQFIRDTRAIYFLEKQLTQHPTSNSDVLQWFKDHPSSYQIPASAHASHLFLTIHDAEKSQREKTIHHFHQLITRSQATLSDLAKQHSDDPRTKNTGGNLGWFSVDRVPADFAEQVFQLKPNQLSEPFLTKLGWHIVLLHDKRPARAASFDECRDEIFAQLESQRRNLLTKSLLETWRANHNYQLHINRLSKLTPPTSSLH